MSRYFLPLPPEIHRGFTANASFGHRYLMRLLPDDLRAPDPRADAQLLWHVRDAGVELHVRDDLVIPGAYPLAPLDITVPLMVRVEATYCPPISLDPDILAQLPALPRSKRVRVPDDRLEPWAHELLARRNIDAQLRDVHPGIVRHHGKVIPQATLTFTARSPLDPQTVAAGIGRSKNYGCGLIVQSPIQ